MITTIFSSRYFTMLVLAFIVTFSVWDRNITTDAYLINMVLISGFCMLAKTIVEFSK